MGWSAHALLHGDCLTLFRSRSSGVYRLGSHSFPTRVSLAFFVPVLYPKSLVTLHAFSLAVPPGSCITVNALGCILVTGAAKSSLLVQEPHLCQAAIQDSLTLCSSRKSYQLLPCDWSSGRILLASQTATCTQFVSVIPFVVSPLLPAQNIHVRVRTLGALLPPGTSELSLFSNPTWARFLEVPTDEQSEESITLLTGSGCGQFIVAPVYDLRSPHGVWGVSILAPHSLAAANFMAPFPTPPPSPPLIRPFVRRYRGPSASPVRLNAKEWDSPRRREIQQRITANASPLIIRSPTTITRYLSSLISLAIWLIKLCLLRILFYYMARRLPYEGVDDWSEREDEADEDITIVWKGLEPRLAEEDELSVSSAADTEFTAESNEDEMKGSEYLPLLLDVASEDISILLRPAIGLSSVDLIEMELNGQPMTRNVQALDDGIFIVGIRGPVYGRVTIVAS